MGTSERSGQSPHGGGEVHVADYLRLLYRRRWIALAGFLAVFLWLAISSLKTTPVYETTTQLLIERQSRQTNSLDSALNQESNYEGDFLPTELNILRSRALARRTLTAMGQRGSSVPKSISPESGINLNPLALLDRLLAGGIEMASLVVRAPRAIEPPAPDETTEEGGRIDAFLGGLSVEPVRNTVLVNLTYRSPDPAYATQTVNALAKEYIQQSIELRFRSSKVANDFLGKQLEEQRTRVEQSERALQQYLENNRAVAVDDKQNVTVQRLADLNGAVTQAKMTRIEKEAAVNQVTSLRRSRGALDAFPAILGNSFIQQLKTEVAELQKQQAQLTERYGERHPEMIRATTQLRTAEAKLQAEIDKVVESVRSDFVVAQARERSLVEALETQKNEALNLNRQGIEYAVLQREALSARQLYDNLLQRTNESGVSGEFKGTNIQIVDEAEVPRSPVLPNTVRDLQNALLAGLVVALGLVFGVERLDSRIKSPEDLRRLGLAFLGMVPAVSQKGEAGAGTLLGNAGVPAAFEEAMRSVRTAVVFSSPDDSLKTLVVTSTGPHEGKTLVASNLGVALAQTGQRTLIIDGDMRRPRVHAVFGVPQEPGLSNVLVGNAALPVALHATGIPNLTVMAAGHLPPNPAELLGSAQYDQLISELKQHFDWIVVDAPPVMAVTDAAVLAHGSGGVVFVIGADMTSRQSAEAAVEQLTSAKARFVGAILNRVNIKRHSYYYAPYHRKEYSEYHSSAGAS
ncbi:MAG: polysaccharide biosynthesis tyrosine autokinase [Vicinamibacterales bacterium]